MSLINSAGSNPYHLISSIAGSQRNHGDSDRVKADADGRRFSLDKNQLTENTLGHVSATETSPDRDPNGRVPLGQEQADEEDGQLRQEANPNVDEEGLRGQSLDLSA